MTEIKRLAVFCGSGPGSRPSYVDAARAFGKLLSERCDGFVALPGGIGTLEEFFEVWTRAQLGVHDKPYRLLNVAVRERLSSRSARRSTWANLP